MYKDYIKWGSASLSVIVGLCIIIWSMVIPPEGVISGSVLTVVGEIFTFAGAVFGISTHYAIETEKLKVNIDNEVKRQVDAALKTNESAL